MACSSEVERPAVNRNVVGSTPTLPVLSENGTGTRF